MNSAPRQDSSDKEYEILAKNTIFAWNLFLQLEQELVTEASEANELNEFIDTINSYAEKTGSILTSNIDKNIAAFMIDYRDNLLDLSRILSEYQSGLTSLDGNNLGIAFDGCFNMAGLTGAKGFRGQLGSCIVGGVIATGIDNIAKKSQKEDLDKHFQNETNIWLIKVNDLESERDKIQKHLADTYDLKEPAPTEASQPKPAPKKASQPSQLDKKGTLVADNADSRINVRVSPSTAATAQHYGLPGDTVFILDRTTGSDNYIWFFVEFEVSSAQGWIRGDFIKF